jgi:hypothetical protein
MGEQTKTREYLEQRAFWLVGAIFAGVLLGFAFAEISGRGERGFAAVVDPTAPLPGRQRLLLDSAFAFLEQVPPAAGAGNPFSVVLPNPQPAPPPDGAGAGDPPAPQPGPDGQEPVVAPAPQPGDAGGEATPTATPAVRVIEYRGCMVTPSGTSLALVHDVTGSSVQFLGEDDRIGDLLVTGFDKNRLVVQGPGGEQDEIAAGTTKEVALR